MYPSQPVPTLDQTIHKLASEQATSKFIALMGRNPKEQDLGSAQYSTEYWHAHRYYTNHFAAEAKESLDIQSHIEVAARTDPAAIMEKTNTHAHNGGYWTRAEGTKHGMNRIQYEQFPADGGAGTAATGGGREHRPDPGNPIVGNTSGVHLAINDQVYDQSFNPSNNGVPTQNYQPSSRAAGTSHGDTGYLGLPTHHNSYSPLSVQGWSGTNSPAPSTSGSGNGEDDGAGYPYYSGSEGGYDISQGHTPDHSGNY